MSDVTDFADMEIEFELGQPFLPFQQLMAVLPAASKDILPVHYQVWDCGCLKPPTLLKPYIWFFFFNKSMLFLPQKYGSTAENIKKKELQWKFSASF